MSVCNGGGMQQQPAQEVRRVVCVCVCAGDLNEWCYVATYACR
jgi:hypothetical protein